MASQDPAHETQIPQGASAPGAGARGEPVSPQAELSAGAGAAPAEPVLHGAAPSSEPDGLTPHGPPPGFIRQYELVERVKAYDPLADEDLLNRAYVVSMRAHGDQKRASGDPYFSHPLAVAGILTELKLDPATIAVGLLHDVAEDTDVTIADLADMFGDEVAQLVDGVTKISKRELAPDTDGKAENFAKFLLATAKDVRVLLIKLTDRLHNMRTLHYIAKPEKRERVARETMEIYAPMAGRIGVHRIKEELEDLAFRFLNPNAYEAISAGLERLAERSVSDVVALSQTLKSEFERAGIPCEVTSREKRAFSIWRKIQRKAVTFEELADIYAFRVIVNDTADCYRALGVIHRAFPMIPGEFDDYISTPKPNGYQSIHTAVLASGESREGQRVEVQIRSRAMHDVAERGVAAHWRYKDQGNGQPNGRPGVEIGRNGRYTPYDWLRGVIDTLNSGGAADQFLTQAKMDLYQDEVFPFTPRGRVIPLPLGATALDFAYALHTEIGDKFCGAKINGVQRPARTPLRNGDVVEILKSDDAPIPTGWEGFIVTGAAKSGMRRRIRELKKQEQEILGERIVTSVFATQDLPFSRKAALDAAEALGFPDRAALYAAVGRMDISGQQVIEAVFPNLSSAPAEGPDHRLTTGSIVPRGTIILDGVTPGGTVQLATCCRPLPGERLIGIREEEGGIAAHRIDCQKLASSEDLEWLNLTWANRDDQRFSVPIVITVNNRSGALGHVGTTLAKYGADILDLTLAHREEAFSDLCFDVAVKDAKHLINVLAGLRASDYVVAADRREETMSHDDEERRPFCL